MATISDEAKPRLGLFLREGPALVARFYRAFGRLGERGPADGPKLMVIPGFVANDRTTLGLQRALAAAGYRVTGWGLGLNKGVKRGHARPARRADRGFGGGRQGHPGRLEPRRRLRPRSRQGAARSRREGDHPGLAFLRRPARQQCLAALRMGRRPSGRRAADRDRCSRKSRRCRRSPLVAPDGIVSVACARGEPRRERPAGRARLQPYGLRGQRPRLSRRSSRRSRASKSSPRFRGEGDRAKCGGGASCS